MRRRGFTLVELLVVMAITGILASAVLHLLADTRAAARSASRHQRWSGEARAAFTVLGRDVRAADAVRAGEERLELQAGARLVVWRREAVEGTPTLVREADGHRQVMAGDVETLRVERTGRRLTMGLGFLAEDGSYRAETSHTTTVALPEEAR
ncbi:MAG: prepilin-type N-terminal cleavage/methylation domain-containing protein [bacterium]